MNLKKLAFALLVLTGMASLFCPNVFAAAAYFTCSVDQVGPNGTSLNSGTRVFLTDTNTATPAWTGSKEFLISYTRSKEFLGVALAALAYNKNVVVFTDPSPGLHAITVMYVVK